MALFAEDRGLCGEWVHSQIERHAVYGGVVPDVASREHLSAFPRLLREVEGQAEGAVSEIAVTVGPGLAGCLALGVSLAQALSQVYRVPLCGIHHLRGHLFSPFIQLHADSPADFPKTFADLLPHLGLIVSGGNTLLVSIETDGRLRVWAKTVDDAAGEALDKGAKLLGMAYPGGPLIEKAGAGGNSKAFDFPRPSRSGGDDRFSFSGLKTSLRYRLEKMSDAELARDLRDLCASYESAVVDALVIKTGQVLRRKRWRSLGLSGGVANNGRLRGAFTDLAGERGLPLYIAERAHTGDNAAMIAFAAYADRMGRLSAKGGRLSFDPALPLLRDDSGGS